MINARTSESLSRRAALAGLSAAGAGIAFAAAGVHAAAQTTTEDMAKHPLVGSWLAGRTPTDLGVAHWGPDGSMTYQGNLVSAATGGALTYSDPLAGVWEPDGERGIHFTFTTKNYNAAGAVIGSGTVDGYPVASADGRSFWDDGKRGVLTLRDATGAVTQAITPIPGIGGVRMAPGKPGYDEMLAMLAAQKAATPTP